MKNPLQNPIQIAHAEQRTAWMVGYDEGLDAPYGYVIFDGNRIEVENLDALFTKGQWTFDSEPIDKARERKFESRSEAARYAARVRWGTRGEEISGSEGGKAEQYGLVQEPTNDIQRVLDGEPYARMLDIPPDIVQELETAVAKVGKGKWNDAVDSPEVQAAQRRLTEHYATALTHPDAPPWNENAELATGFSGPNAPTQFAAAMAERRVRAEWVSHNDSVNGLPSDYQDSFLAAVRGDKKASVVVSVDSVGLEGIVKDGRLKTQFETKTSGGYIGYGNDAHIKRATTEAINYGFHPSADPSKRPVYGSLMPRGVLDGDVNMTEQYGGIYLVMKPYVRQRTTFSTSDSLGRGQIQYPLNGSGKARPRTATRMGTEYQTEAFLTPKGERVKFHGYVETQIHGGVRIGNISKVVVHKAYTLRQGTLDALTELGIPYEIGTDESGLAKQSVEKAMKKLIASNNEWWLYQTGFTTVYEGSNAEETFPSGYAEDANGNQTPIRNLLVALEKADWTLVEQPDLPIEKGRERKFQSRSEAARYAAQIRWGNRPSEQTGERQTTTEASPLEVTWDVNEAIRTGRPYGPLLEENYPPEVKAAIENYDPASGIKVQAEQYMVVHNYFRSHLEPSQYSPEVRDQMRSITATSDEAQLFGDRPKQHYSGLANSSEVAVSEMASKMTNEAFKKAAADKWGEKYSEDALTVTKNMQASPNKALTISVGTEFLWEVDATGRIGTQFGTGTSRGHLNLQTRAAHEAISYGVHPATLPQSRPVYGNYHPLGVQHTSASGAGQYGNVQLVLKPEVHTRATFTMQDSLGMVRRASPVTGEITRPQVFPNLSLGKSNPAHPTKHLRRVKAGKSHEYSETQIHGGVKLTDVSHIVFNGNWRDKNPKPPQSLVLFARKHKLKIITAVYSEPKEGEKWGIIDLNGDSVQKTFDAIIAELNNAVFKAKSFSGNRSAAASYAAQIRWGNRNNQTPPPLPDGWKIESERQSNSGYTSYILEGPSDDGGTLSAFIRAGEDGVSVELNRVGGPNHRKIGEITTSAMPEMGHDNLPPRTFAVDFIGVHSKDRRKGYATLMLELARAKSYDGYKIQHSTQLTDDGAAWATATKALDDVEKGRPRKFSTRTEAAQYAARVRWGNRTGDGPKPLSPQMQAMKDEADAIRAELDDIVKNMDMENLQRSSPKTRPRTWTDEKGAVQIDTLSEEMVPSPRLADAHDRVLVLGDKMIDESLARTGAKQAAGDKRSTREIYAESMHEVVSELTPVGGEIKLRDIVGGSEKEQESMTGALQSMASVMPSSWVASSGDSALDMQISMNNANPFFRPSAERRGYKTGPDLIAFPPPSQIAQDFKTSTLQDIVGHEYTHMVENRKPAVKALSIAFITHRTTGYQIGGSPPLRQRVRTDMREERVTAVSGNLRMELSRDSFSSLYSGRRYDSATKYDPRAAYARTPNNDRRHESALEVLTTGVEQYLNGNIGGFDSNHMSFVLGTLVTT